MRREANRRHASTSSASRSGSSSSTCSRVCPDASRSSTSVTRMRMPRMQGRPPHCRVFTVIRSIKLLTRLLRVYRVRVEGNRGANGSQAVVQSQRRATTIESSRGRTARGCRCSRAQPPHHLLARARTKSAVRGRRRCGAGALEDPNARNQSCPGTLATGAIPLRLSQRPRHKPCAGTLHLRGGRGATVITADCWGFLFVKTSESPPASPSAMGPIFFVTCEAMCALNCP